MSAPTHKRLHLAALLAALFFLGVVVWLALHPSDTVRLPDGTRLRFHGVIQGGRSLSTESRWIQFARKWLPKNLALRLPPRLTFNGRGRTNDLTLLVEVKMPTNGPPAWAALAIEDESGFQFARLGHGSPASSVNPDYRSFPQVNYPRRQSSFKVVVLGTNAATIGSFLVHNPNATSHPEWIPEPMPLRRTNESATLTLRSLEVAAGPHPYMKPGWELIAPTAVWSTSRVRAVMLEDATGNQTGGAPLAPDERAWKLRAVVSSDYNDMAPGSRVMLEGVATPKFGEPVTVALPACPALPGIVAFKLTRLDVSSPPIDPNSLPRGMSAALQKMMIEQLERERYSLRLELMGDAIAPSLSMRAVVRDAKGQFSEATGKGGSPITLPRFPREDTGALSLEIIFSRELHYEFLIDPKEVQRAPAAR